MESDTKSLRYYFGLALAVLLLAVANLHIGQSEFGGYDLSVVIDSGWRVMNGQIPNLSFISTLPPSLYLLVAAAFRVFGVNWFAILITESLLYLLFCFLGLRLCWLLRSVRGNSRERYLPFIYIAAQSLLLLSVNHLYHSTMAIRVATYSILATYTLIRQTSSAQRAREATAHVGFSFAFLLLCKPNTAWAALLFCILCLAMDRRLWLPALQAVVAAAVVDAALLAVFHISFYNAFVGYFGVSNRAVPRMFFPGSSIPDGPVLLTYGLLVYPAIKIIQIIWQDRSREWASSTVLLVVSAALVSLIGFGTNWDLKIVDVPPFLIGAAILADTNAERYKRLIRPLLWSCSLFLIFATYMGVDRFRMKAVGPWAGPTYGPLITIHDQFFGDFKARQVFAEILSQVDIVSKSVAGQKIFFGPRMEFLYARNGFVSPAHVPVWWHPGTSYPLSLEPTVDKAWEDDNFDVLIFAKNDRTRFPGILRGFIRMNYIQDMSFKAIDVFYRR
jgi:hypothetical protein